MWAAGDLPFAIAIALLIQRWLATQEARTSQLAVLAAGSPETLAAGSLDREQSPNGDQALAPPLPAEPPRDQ